MNPTVVETNRYLDRVAVERYDPWMFRNIVTPQVSDHQSSVLSGVHVSVGEPNRFAEKRIQRGGPFEFLCEVRCEGCRSDRFLCKSCSGRK